MKQLNRVFDSETADPVQCVAAIKELSAEWLVEMAEKIFNVGGFRKADMSDANDGRDCRVW